ncbi:hypothetical protein FD755_012446 [Muntiacus reevesi]|uniref:RING-type E3 ubiquitin transferase n=1 Tax=Muntiacus reevesi TaxID=9886 RepID=A0A5N3XRT6_MUNRE|nr:hypothetical protein FD755_012446 [Muntiacus reevesi]
MGAKQSGPAAANGRTRAYSGSDLPSSSSSSGGANGTAGGGARAAAAGRFPAQVPSAHQPSASGGAAAASAAPRSRSLGGAVGTVASGARAAQSTFSIPNSSSGPYGSQDSVHSSPEDGGSSGGRDRPASGGPGGPRLVIGSLPAHLSPHMFGEMQTIEDKYFHIIAFFTRHDITYNYTQIKNGGDMFRFPPIFLIPLCIFKIENNFRNCADVWANKKELPSES